MQLFEFTKVLFENPTEWFSLTKSEKRKHFYMTSQFMSIAFPLQAHILNHIKINQEASMDFWQKFMRRNYKSVPSWMFIKGKAKRQEEKEKKTINQKLVAEYCKAYNMDIKVIQDAMLHFPDEIIAEIKQFEKITKQ